MANVSNLICLQLQGLKLMDEQTMKSWPRREWHKSSRPSLHRWLLDEATDATKQRLACIGNIAMPHVTFFGLQMLGHAEMANK